MSLLSSAFTDNQVKLFLQTASLQNSRLVLAVNRLWKEPMRGGRMPSKLRRWQTRIDVGKRIVLGPNEVDDNPPRERVYLYGETIEKLREAVKTYLLSENPLCFGNGGDHIAGCIEYYHIILGGPERDRWGRFETPVIKGWKNLLNTLEEKVESFEEAVNHFVESELIPEKGPDYRSKAIVGSDLRLPLLEKILREAEEYPINDLIQRGWHLIALEYKGELSVTGELANRKAIFVLGHPEVQAASLTMKSKYMDRPPQFLEN